jgi:hypothetical protein
LLLFLLGCRGFRLFRPKVLQRQQHHQEHQRKDEEGAGVLLLATALLVGIAYLCQGNSARSFSTFFLSYWIGKAVEGHAGRKPGLLAALPLTSW